MSIKSLLDSLLDELECFIQTFDKTYAKKFANSSTIGAHIRHCLEHIDELFHGIDKNLINYDLRERDKVLENCPKNSFKNDCSHKK